MYVIGWLLQIATLMGSSFGLAALQQNHVSPVSDVLLYLLFALLGQEQLSEGRVEVACGLRA